ncbi:hypothetical protein HK405_005341 [Cladochytrium tenue]|nr:hypothetical protein HK405_005341 [Cladochytrium tenue]
MASPANRNQEGIFGRLGRKAMTNPFVLPAAGMTGYALYRMTATAFQGDPVKFQGAQMQRVVFQAATIAVVMAGVWYNDYEKKQAAAKAARQE